MTALELVEIAIDDFRQFKSIGLELKKIGPCREAALRLVEAYQSGKAEAWMTAYLLGCNGHAAGYETVRDILRSNAGKSSASYAGVALAEIRGMGAYHDIRAILFGAQGMARRGAAHGLVKLKPPRAVDVLLEAYKQRLLPRYDVAHHIAKCGIADDRLLQLLDSKDERKLRLALGVVSVLSYKGLKLPPPGPNVARATWRLLQSGEVKMHALTRESLREWAESAAH